MRILILGAVPCGLVAAYQLHKRGHDNWHTSSGLHCPDSSLRKIEERNKVKSTWT